MFSLVAVATLLSGQVFEQFNWQILNHVSWPPVLITLLVVLGLQQQSLRRARRMGNVAD